jgi:hypothetical protein
MKGRLGHGGRRESETGRRGSKVVTQEGKALPNGVRSFEHEYGNIREDNIKPSSFYDNVDNLIGSGRRLATADQALHYGR